MLSFDFINLNLFSNAIILEHSRISFSKIEFLLSRFLIIIFGRLSKETNYWSNTYQIFIIFSNFAVLISYTYIFLFVFCVSNIYILLYIIIFYYILNTRNLIAILYFLPTTSQIFSRFTFTLLTLLSIFRKKNVHTIYVCNMDWICIYQVR